MKERVLFTKEMKETHTILAPDMLNIHFEFFKQAFNDAGYKIEILKNRGRKVVDEGLTNTHNDTCYPALLVVGQFIDALKSGNYDLNKVALIMTQTGGGCRASNYINLIRKALEKSNLGHIPVISLNFSNLEKNPGFNLDLKIMKKLFASVVYGDTLMLLRNQTIAYESVKGTTSQLVDNWTSTIKHDFSKGKSISKRQMNKRLKEIVKDFSHVEITSKKLLKVGVVGEIYIKYSDLGNNELENFLFSEGCEVMVPGLLAFMLYNIDVRIDDINLYGGSRLSAFLYKRALRYIQKVEKMVIKNIAVNPRFTPPFLYSETKSIAEGVVSYGNKMGEGWLLTAEMLELCESGYSNIVVAQPFGCLPNHIVGKGMITKVTKKYKSANIVSIDYDPGATKVNQENRIKLMLSIGREKM